MQQMMHYNYYYTVVNKRGGLDRDMEDPCQDNEG